MSWHKADPAKKAESEARKAEVHSDLQESVKDLLAELKAGKSARLLKYLEFSARFYKYSPGNQVMIANQRPDATHVAGYTTWRNMGQQVRKGEKGIAILQPRPYTKEKEKENGDIEVSSGMAFKIAYVFDVSQLEENPDKPLPTFFVPLADDHEALYSVIAQAVRSDGITLEEGNTGNAQGWSAGGRIRLKEGLDSSNASLTLIHEYAHEMLHHVPDGKTFSKQKKELHAEATAYIVASRYGLKSPYSSDYIQNWGSTEKELMQELATIKSTAQHIIEKIEGREEREAEKEDIAA